jgi:hypothetical protein
VDSAGAAPLLMQASEILSVIGEQNAIQVRCVRQLGIVGLAALSSLEHS